MNIKWSIDIFHYIKIVLFLTRHFCSTPQLTQSTQIQINLKSILYISTALKYICIYMYMYTQTHTNTHIHVYEFKVSIKSYQVSLVSYLDGSYSLNISKLYLDKMVQDTWEWCLRYSSCPLAFGFSLQIIYVFLSQHRVVKYLMSRYINALH